MSSWNDSTNHVFILAKINAKTVCSYLEKWKIFCVEQVYDPFHTTVTEVLVLLQNSINTINTTRSALSAVIHTDSVAMGSHPLVVRSMKGI